jgi:hypothetical protein
VDRVDLFVSRLNCVLSVNGILKFFLHCHVVKVKLVVVGSADKVCVGPVQKIRVIVVAPPWHLEPAHWLGRPFPFVVDGLPTALLVPLLQSVLPHRFALQQRLLQFRVVRGGGLGRRGGAGVKGVSLAINFADVSIVGPLVFDPGAGGYRRRAPGVSRWTLKFHSKYIKRMLRSL